MIDRLRKLPYAKRAGLIAGLGVLLIAAITLTVVLLAGRALHSQARARAVDTGRLSARLLDEQTRRLGDLVSALAIDLEGVQATGGKLPAGDAARITKTLGALNSRQGIDFSFFTDAAGNVLLISPEDDRVVGRNFAFRDWYRGVTQIRSPYVSKTYKSAAFDRPRVVAVAARVDSRAGPAGFLVATERGQTQRFTEAFERDRGTNVTVIDQGGVIVAGAGVNDQALHVRLANPAVRAALRGKATVRETTVDGQQVISAYEPVPAIGWVVRTDIRVGDAFADVGRIRLLVVALALLFTVALIALALTLARNSDRSSQARLNERLQAQLLPRVRLAASDAVVSSLYRPGEGGMLIGGDFHDAVELDDGRIAVVVGDVVGHGPDAAALGAALRAGWRALTVAGTDPAAAMAALDRAVRSERNQPDAFSSAVCAMVSADRRTVSICLAGHPPPILVAGGRIEKLKGARGPLLGVLDDAQWPVTDFPMDEHWALLLYTDGLVEGGAGRRHLVAEGAVELRSWIADLVNPNVLYGDALWALVERARSESGGALADDVALVAITVPEVATQRPPAPESAGEAPAHPVLD